MSINVARPTDPKLDEIHADWWDEGETVSILPVKTFAMQTRAQSRASVIPEGYTTEQIRAMTETDIAKLDMYDPGRFHESLFRDMVKDWTLLFPPTEDQEVAGGKGDPIPFSIDTLLAMPEREGRFIADEIAKRGQGRAAAATTKRGGDFREPTP